MTKPGFIIGIVILIISIVTLLPFLLMVATGDTYEENYKYILYSVIGIVISIALMSTNSTSDREKQEFEEYKRMKQQEQAMYYRYANAKGKPIEEYTMDQRTKLIVYYDRLPTKYQKQLVERADQLYRRFENEQYTQK